MSDVRIMCKTCNTDMTLESTLNDTNGILVCRKCKEHVNLSCSGSDGDRGVGMPPPSTKPKSKRFAILGGIVRNNDKDFYLFKIMVNDLDTIKRYKEMINWFLADEGFMTTTQIGYYDKKEE